jgi:hypothetical protein
LSSEKFTTGLAEKILMIRIRDWDAISEQKFCLLVLMLTDPSNEQEG